ncbi:MAG: Rrf2 family transcriptional regulator [Janthinobacterium lividum]
MKLGTKGQYAVMAMADLASQSQDQPIPLADIAQRQHIPLPYLEQIFVKLRRGGLVKSIRGYQGGYNLQGCPENLKIFEIMQAVEEDISTTRCGSAMTLSCQGKTGKCLTHNLWEGLQANIEHYLNSITLQDLCQNQQAAFFSRSAQARGPHL